MSQNPRSVRISPKGIALIEFVRDDAPSLGLEEMDAYTIGERLVVDFDGTKTMRQLYLESKESDGLLNAEEVE